MRKLVVAEFMTLDSVVEAPYRWAFEFGSKEQERINDTLRIVQLTPPGSACSIHLSSGIHGMPPGSLRGLQIVVSDIEAARRELIEGGVEVSPVRHVEGGVWLEGKGGDWNSFAFFSDPDGNSWVLQERPAKSQGGSV
ncbi:MAG TPA: hypothetical protein VFS50_00185 [Meiothermus sp.]|nr:hypothetical protein [Meiothermus sp.]